MRDDKNLHFEQKDNKMLLVQKITLYLKLMRFNKPIGILLLLWPSLWALWIAAKGVPELKILIVFILGTILMRAAGCVINDIADRHFDKYVARTKDRPLTMGAVSLKEAIILLVILSMLVLALVLLLNRFTIALAVGGAFLAFIYPFTKRFISFPQFILGLAFAWGVLMAFSAVLTTIPPIAYLVFTITVIWALIYDTEYAMVDRDDDLKLGIKSTAILFGNADRFWIGVLQVIFVSLILFSGKALQLNTYYYFSCFIVIVLFCYQQILLHKRKNNLYFKAFLNNQWIGLIVFLGIFMSY